jgi:parallel beta-helix repeat protein
MSRIDRIALRPGLPLTIGLVALTAVLSLLASAPAAAQDQPPRTRANSPTAFVTIYVDRSDDGNLTACTAAANDCSLRGAINKANGDAANIYTIYFSPTVTAVSLSTPLPIITANELWIIGVNGVPKIDALSMSNGNVFTVNASQVIISGLSIVNANGSIQAADIRINGGTQNQISNNFLGTLPGATGCTFGGVARNSFYGVMIDSAVTGSSSSGNGSVYVYGNTIGCHAGSGIGVFGADYVRIGEMPNGTTSANYIGVSASGITLTNSIYGVYLATSAGNNAPRHNIIANNIIAGNSLGGIIIVGNGIPNSNSAYNNVVRANRIGVGPTGTRIPNYAFGVYITDGAFQNFIGGADTADRNIISGNTGNGVVISGSVGIGVLGNYIGTNVSGTAALGNSGGGVRIIGGAANTIGGAIYGIIPATKGNLIQYNTQGGVQLSADTHSNQVLANSIRYNTGNGVSLISGAYDNVVGGDVITSGNSIGNNTAYGVYLDGPTTTGNVVKYNDIVNNLSNGITLDSDAHDNTLGGDIPSAYNLINGNNGSGIAVFDSGPNTILYNSVIGNSAYGVLLEGAATQGTVISNTTLSGNVYDGIGERSGAAANFWNSVSIYGNGGLGIDKEASSNTVNLINAPGLVITSVNRSTGVVQGRASASAFLVITEIELYRVEVDASGYGEGKTYVGSATTDANGNWQIVDPSPDSGCYTAFESLIVIVPIGSSEFSRSNCSVMLPAIVR